MITEKKRIKKALLETFGTLRPTNHYSNDALAESLREIIYEVKRGCRFATSCPIPNCIIKNNYIGCNILFNTDPYIKGCGCERVRESRVSKRLALSRLRILLKIYEEGGVI